MSTDLATRILAAIEETERIARSTTDGQPYDEWDAVGAKGDDDIARSVASVVGIATVHPTPAARAIAMHIAHNDPAAVLRRCAADRTVLELHKPVPDHGRGSGVPGFGKDECDEYCNRDQNGQHEVVCSTCRDLPGDPLDAPCATLIALAECYGIEGS